MITALVADIILLTESDGEKVRIENEARFNGSSHSPPPSMPNTEYPTNVHISRVLLAHQYTIAFEVTCHCLEFCGLRNETVRLVRLN